MPDKETVRIEAFSDGVFAIAVTLLILEIRLPHTPEGATNGDVLRALLHLWPSYLAFVLSFGTILVMWINHHDLFRLVRSSDRRFMFANGFVLMMVTFVNFPTAVLADHLNRPGAGACVAASFYCGTYVIISISYALLLRTAIPNMPTEFRQGPHSPVRRIRAAYLMGFLVYCTATIVAIFAPYVGVAICSALLVLWTVLNYGPGR